MPPEYNVLYIIDQLPIGGAERVFLDILRLMKGKITYDACLITGGGKLEAEVPDFVYVHRLNRFNKFSLKSAIKAYKLFRRYNILHVHMRHNFRYIYLIKILTGLKAKVILHDHYGGIDIDQGPPFKFWQFIKPDMYIGVCNDLRHWATVIWRLPASISYTLVNLPGDKFLNNKQPKVDPGNRKDIVILGNIKKIKNQELGIAVARLVSKNIVLIGRNQDEEYFDYINTIGKDIELTIEQEIHEPDKVLNKFEIGLCTSLSESGPLVILEYLLCGTPFLSYKTGGVSDIVSKYFPEYFIENHDPIEWASRLQMILSKNYTIDQSKVHAMLENWFNPEHYREKLLKIYADA
jgi:glycosyltransferase involved in cell wall biosynthesis